MDQPTEIVVMLSDEHFVSLDPFTLYDRNLVLQSSEFFKAYDTEYGPVELWRYIPERSPHLSFIKYEKIKHLFWVPEMNAKEVFNWSDWFLSPTGKPKLLPSNSGLSWRHPTYEEACERQRNFNQAPLYFESVMDINIEECHIRAHLTTIPYPEATYDREPIL